MTDTVLAQIAALKAKPIQALKQQWRDLFESEPPPYNRRFLEHRLAYRIQELAYGGLKPETIKRLRALAEDLDGGDPARRRQPAKRPTDRRHAAHSRIPGRRALRDGARRRLRVSGPAIQIAVRDRARHHRHALEWVDLFRFEESAGRSHEEADRPEAPLRGLHPQIQRGRPGAGIQLARCAARGLRGLHREPEARGLGAGARPLRRRRHLRRDAGTSGVAATAGRHRGRARRRGGGLQDRPAQPLADGFCQARRGVRSQQRHLRQRHAVVQHDDLDGTADAQHPALLRAVRARGHRRAHPRQVRRLPRRRACGWAASFRSATTSGIASSS